ncbi:hypothetical protein [Nocardioides pinisoli]|uniref:HNH endonuclease n=1 Tax=Nocardioides pinisoli TaxID=2950279 RepID=A0ABT1KUM4_9ACTN|nr:hypothetical protein [Nocardioides pinisoli]MCP3420321.1 hypothetical protein [Nocardioides pinisoli]
MGQYSSSGTQPPRITNQLWKGFKVDFSTQQFGRCGYCELPTIAGQHGDVEHFAPKSAVTQFGGKVGEEGTETEYVAALKGRRPSDKWVPGYWWLAYDWGNYLLSCSICNSDWKGNLFPVRQPPPRLRPRTQADPPEECLLLNPYGRRDPARHLRFNIDGSVEPRNGSVYGRETIRTCGLHRLALRDARQRTCERVHLAAEKALQEIAAGAPHLDNEHLETLHAIGIASRQAEFPGVVRAIILDQLAPLTWRTLDRLFGP